MSTNPLPTDKPAVVTCGLPYANGNLHIGHMRTYVSGDALSRSLRKLGQKTAFVCGSDMHGTPVAVNAWKEGKSPREFALFWHEKYKQTFLGMSIEFDNYGHTDDETNTMLTREIVRKLDDSNHIYDKKILVAWDPVEDQPLPDRYVEGTCPHCGATARGDECDDGCQRHLEPGEVLNPKSIITGNEAEYRNKSHKFFRISDFQNYLQGFINRLEGTTNAKNQPREWIDGSLHDWCITRNIDWGISYPSDEKTDLVLYVWVDAVVEYISSTKQYSDRVGSTLFDWEEAWKQDGEIIHVIGRDIIQHHAVFWPAMLHGSGYSEPRAIMATGFVNLNKKAFSTSRNRAIWVDDYFSEDFDPDLLRYYLVTVGSLQDDIDFSWANFADKVNGELVGNIGNFLYRSMLFAQREYGGAPEKQVSKEVQDRIQEAIVEFSNSINNYSLRNSALSGAKLAQYGNAYIQQNEPWKLLKNNPDLAAQIIRDCVQICKAVCILLSPTMPNTTQKLWEEMGEFGSIHQVTLSESLESPPLSFEPPSEPFMPIDDKKIKKLDNKLEQQITSPSNPEKQSLVSQDNGQKRIPFEHFQKLDLRVGKILTAKEISGSEKLLKIEVDIGSETRQIVAGIRKFYSPDDLIGKSVVVITNLEKATIFGTESNGMILAAGDTADLLTTYANSPPGEKIR
tara:strand:- start:5897 stop:7936 length:2040 start_codon:yes stop_codon:yes gene_type:complete